MSIISTLSIIVSAFYLALATFTLVRGLALRIHRTFFVLTLSLSAYCVFQALTYEAADAEAAWRWFMAGTACWIGFLPGQLLVVLDLTRPTLERRWWQTLLLFVPVALVAPGGVLLGTTGPDAMIRTPAGWARNLASVPVFTYLATFVFLGYTVTSLVLLARWMRRLKSLRQKRQVRWLVGTGLVSLASVGAFFFLQPLTDTPEAPRFAQLFTAVWAIGYAVAIFRHRLMAPSPALAADAILDAIQDLVLLADVHGKVLTANPRAFPLLGYDPRELEGRSLFTLGKDPAALEALLESVPETVQPARWTEAVLMTREDVEVPVLLSASPILDQDGDRVGIALVAQDQRPMHDALKTARIQSIGVLAGGIAHDFNNLLTAIGGYVSLAGLDVPAGSETRRRLDEAGKACVRAQGLTQQLLTFSRGGAPVRRATSLEDLLRDSASFGASGSAVRVQIDAEPGLWLVNVDEGQIAQVVHNLALNAVQAMPEGGTLYLRAENLPAGSAGAGGALTTSDRVRLTVRDEGIGIQPEHLDRVFEPFFTTKASGTGLGLATVYSIIRRHDGEVAIDSRPGEGTTFRVDLPRARRITAPMPRQAGDSGGSRGRVLVMDDQSSVLRVAEEMLASLGYEVQGCADGEEAVARHAESLRQTRPFDVVLLDLTVPGGMGGSETLRRMRIADPNLSAVVSSGYAADAEMSNCGRQGFDRALPKPYSLEQLRDAIEGARRTRGTRGNLAQPAGGITP